ncbi:ABC transporter permease [Paenibacillus sp. NPDC057934]|uniref:ABC transporter permease n=1 Tax=Paenibacillus sp. NPDC057934 TaxID=3346282 RepID=UPI0036D9EBB8
MRTRNVSFKWVLYVAAILICLFLTLPLLIIILTSFGAGTSSVFPPKGFSTEWYSHLASQKQFGQAFVNSLIASSGATLLALVGGTLAAMAILYYPFPGSGVLKAFFMSPMVVPKITLGVAYLILFSKMHIAGGLFALILGEAVTVFPFVISIVGSALANLSPADREAAADLGAKPLRVFFTVTLPQLKISLLMASAISFVFTFDQVETALLILRQGSYTLPIQLFIYMEKWQDPTIAVVSVMMIVFALLLFFGIKVALKSAPAMEKMLGNKK